MNEPSPDNQDPPQALLIDMDDTLFEERHYVDSGFRAVAEFLEKERGLPADYSYPSMLAFLELEGRGRVFDRVIERFEVRNAAGLVEACVKAYRAHVPEIQPYDGVRTALAQLAASYPLALVTNGLPQMQRNKLQALGVAERFAAVIYCDEHGEPKPSPAGLLAAAERLGVDPGQALMIGDNPVTDAAAAAAAGLRFLRVRTPRFAEAEHVGPFVEAFSHVPAFLQSRYSGN